MKLRATIGAVCAAITLIAVSFAAKPPDEHQPSLNTQGPDASAISSAEYVIPLTLPASPQVIWYQVPQFDPSLGTLDRIELEWQGSGECFGQFSDISLPYTRAVRTFTKVEVYPYDTLSKGFEFEAWAIVYAEEPGDAPPRKAAYRGTLTQELNGDDFGESLSPIVWDSWIGTGEKWLAVKEQANAQVLIGIGGGSGLASLQQAEGSLTVRYIYTSVLEPAH